MNLSFGLVLLTVYAQVSKVLSTFCRDSIGELDSGLFKVYACKQCYHFLFKNKKDLVGVRGTQYLKAKNNAVYKLGTLIQPDVGNQTLRTSVCLSLTSDECRRWVSCCEDAVTCCNSQLEMPGHVTNASAVSCPHTWDGYSCWPSTPSNSTTHKQCPSFLSYASGKSFKTCGPNGTWFTHPQSGKEYTNYTTCIDTKSQELGVIITVTCNLASIITLIPALVIFVCIRALSTQHRIRLHLNLFLSFIATSIMLIVWNLVVVYEELHARGGTTIDGSVGCKLLATFVRYLEGTCFMWMFAEGYYLHQLLNNTFKLQDNLKPYYIFGWGFPLLPCTIYSIIRITLFDEMCWINNVGGYEWIHYIPNLAAIVLNLLFLCNILRILLTQLTAHPNEPSNYRRALKATFILIPLFGTQWFLTIYRPDFNAPGHQIIDIAHRVTTGLQGVFVALIFCFLNGEVLSFLKSSTHCSLWSRDSHHKGNVKAHFSRLVPCFSQKSRAARIISVSTQFTPDNGNSIDAAPTPKLLQASDNRLH